jgi:hypothetical protein
MLQRFLLDRRCLVLYLGVIGAGCSSGPVTLVPETAHRVAAEEALAWSAESMPTGYQLYRFKWTFRDERASAGGRGSARIAPPDSLRFDAAGPFNSGALAGMVVGGDAEWTDPADAKDTVLDVLVGADYTPLFWTMFGMARPGGASDTLTAFTDTDTRVWQYTSGPDTVQYARLDGEQPKLIAMVRRAGKVIGRTETRLGEDGTLESARLILPKARLDLDFYRHSTPDSFPTEIWRPATP